MANKKEIKIWINGSTGQLEIEFAMGDYEALGMLSTAVDHVKNHIAILNTDQNNSDTVSGTDYFCKESEKKSGEWL